MADKPTPDPGHSERADGPTPNGGAYSVAYFRDASGNPCTKDESYSMEIREYDDWDRDVGGVYMTTIGGESGAGPEV